MNSRSLFKLVAIFANWIKFTLIAFPFSAALVSLKQGKLKYGYDFFEVNHNWSIMIAIAIGLTLNAWNTLSFEERKSFDLKQYLKVRQRYLITGSKGWSLAKVEEHLSKLISSDKYWKRLNRSKEGIWLSKKNRFGFQDVLNLQETDNGFVLESRPKYKIDFVDMARNLGNVQFLSKYLKDQTL